MIENWETENLVIGFEMGLMSQEQVVHDFRDLAEQDILAATERYDEFVQKLQDVACGGSAHVRILQGGPDSSCRADLLDILGTNYATASQEVREQIRDKAVEPLTRDNSFYVQLAVAQMTNPYLIADIIREHSIFSPGPAYYNEDLQKNDNLDDPEVLQAWLDRFGGFNIFAATTLALQRDHAASVCRIMVDNRGLFDAAAHVIAASQDIQAEIRLLKGSTETKELIAERRRSYYVAEFAELIKVKAAEANWLPVGKAILALYVDKSD